MSMVWRIAPPRTESSIWEVLR